MQVVRWGAMAVLALAAGCGGGGGGSSGIPGSNPDPNPNPNPSPPGAGRVLEIAPGSGSTDEALAAFFQAGPGDTIEFGCGFFAFDTGLVLSNTEGVTITGCGRDATVLSFEGSDTATGLLISNVRGVTVTDLTVADTPGDGTKIKSSDFVTYRNVRAMWSSADKPVTAANYQTAMHYECPANPSGAFTYTPSSDNGRYGIYPVQSTNVLLDNVESLGASDAGIYVGQSDDIIVKNSHALYNVAGYEFENTQRADMFGNLAECNTVGYIIYDLSFISQFGYVARMFDNVARNNNFQNFAAGGIVAMVPPGSGLITLAFDQVEIFNNTFKHHKTAAIIVTSYELIGDPGDLRQDNYTEALSIHDNTFINSGYNPPLPNADELQAVVSGDDVSALLPTLIRLKNGGFGAHILWDGLYEEPRPGCPYPAGVPANARGKPLFEDTGVDPSCRYNAYKFDETPDNTRERPGMWLCIENNSFSGNAAAPAFANFHGTEGLEAVFLATDPTGLLGLLTDPAGLLDLVGSLPNLLADNDLTPHHCQIAYGETLPRLPAVTLGQYTPSPDAEPPPTDAEIAALCNTDTGGAVNREALLQVNCPRLSQYRLFVDPDDPTAQPNGGTPFDLNTQLFSDYAVKYRFVFMPPGTAAQYRDGSDGANATYVFPVGTVIAKTFTFPNQANGTVDIVETRLLIKRQDSDGTAVWVGLPYIWGQENGQPVARLALGGGTASVSWNYQDPDTGAPVQGSTNSYSIPHANQCITCHAGTHRPAGAAPIGPKPRNLNKPFPYPSGAQNQIAYWVQNGLLTGAPALAVDPNTMIATNVERLPRFDVPGDGGHTPGSDADIEARVRAYLEVNCAHCHNPGGAASNTGLFLDTLRPVGANYGICKTPTAAGAGSGGRPFDITPASADDSIVPFRMNSNAPEIQMPAIARSVIHAEAVMLVRQWIDQVVDESYPNADACSGGGGLLSGLGL